MMNQTLAIFVDAYRELQAKKMFWIVMALNILAILCFGLFGAKEHAYTFLWYETATNVPRAQYEYKSIFSTVVVGIWFTWIAALLALVSTAGMFPDFLSSGSIDLYLAKPISRLRLFLTKYAAGLVFATLQVSVFATLSFFVLGLRASVWEPGIFLSIPLLVIFFSYLFGFCALLGVLTRSTIAALLLTILAWGILAGVDWADNRIVEAQIQSEHMLPMFDDEMSSFDAKIKAAATEPDSASQVSALQQQRAEAAVQRSRVEIPGWMLSAEKALYAFKTITPKTRQTTDLLDRYLFSDQEMRQTVEQQESISVDAQSQPRRGPRRAANGMEYSARLELERTRSIFWIIGTSLLFEAVCLALAAWNFCTCDF